MDSNSALRDGGSFAACLPRNALPAEEGGPDAHHSHNLQQEGVIHTTGSVRIDSVLSKQPCAMRRIRAHKTRMAPGAKEDNVMRVA
eukprot:CAMPEP_0181254630 /NCGR_PEP_ID=MMETSP1096-20121128/48715_1 /TAXON_ID=156174 ORGANISM="Chrysochromulina ericina, Strain CCMP281" /NCGR_SAMPLE_ID=MMETSP1096 /ASSEMBLY_ACC=CAM_ASM_000453 /LENGTH=85 /DNA_ID=CAMNT_0023352697 /DNA_START=584 /DNA_END=842 /DNA_ORIENTATION=-